MTEILGEVRGRCGCGEAYMGDTRDSGVLVSACDVLEMSVGDRCR